MAGAKLPIPAAGAQTVVLAMAALGLLLLLGTLLGKRLGSRRWGIPEALLAGTIGLLLGPSGPLPRPLLKAPLIAVWQPLPLILLTLVFATLLLGKPLPRPRTLWRPLSAQVLLAIILALGQYLVAALVVLLLPLPGLHPLMGCLIEVAYEGGHGSAAAMGPSYAQLGFEAGEDLGLALATVGLLASAVVGGLVVVVARRLGWLRDQAAAAGTPASAGTAAAVGTAATTTPTVIATATAPATAPVTASAAPANGAPGPEAAVSVPDRSAVRSQEGSLERSLEGSTPPLQHLRAWAVNLALAGAAVAFGWLALEGLRMGAERLGGGIQAVVQALPVFPMAIVGSLLVRLALDRSGRAGLASAALQALMGAVAADLLITCATASLELPQLSRSWQALSALAIAGLVWNLAVVLLLGRVLLPEPWFERGIVEFGQATGVAASGLLLLRMADPEDRSDALAAFSIKQLLMQPLVAGGLLTVVAPMLVTQLGLRFWSALCLAGVLLAAGLGVLLARQARDSATPA